MLSVSFLRRSGSRAAWSGALIIAIVTVLQTWANASTVIGVNFASGYTNGALVGQDSWAQTGSSTVNPIQVTSGSAIVFTGGQDVYKPFASSLSLTASSYLLTRIDFVPTAAQATGDYFFHVSDPAGTTTNFYQRLFAKAVSGSVQFGLGTNGSGVYGTGLFPLNQTATVVMKWNVIAGQGNDTIDLFVNPVDPANPSGSPYFSTATWTGVEPSTLAAINLRQGSGVNAPTINVSAINIEFVPEPSTYAMALAGLACGGYTMFRRRKRA